MLPPLVSMRPVARGHRLVIVLSHPSGDQSIASLVFRVQALVKSMANNLGCCLEAWRLLRKLVREVASAKLQSLSRQAAISSSPDQSPQQHTAVPHVPCTTLTYYTL